MSIPLHNREEAKAIHSISEWRNSPNAGLVASGKVEQMNECSECAFNDPEQ